MAELLQAGHINNRLLCEFATHPAFSKLMTDLEIYVDGLINLQIQTINSALNAVRQRLSEQFHPGNDDYFLKIIQNDLKTFISDIRSHHKKDSENAADINITDKINETFDDINNYNGNLIVLLMYHFCKEIHLPLSSLSNEEIQTMRALFQRSEHYKSEARPFRKGRKK